MARRSSQSPSARVACIRLYKNGADHCQTRRSFHFKAVQDLRGGHASARKKARQGGDGEGPTRLVTLAANDGAEPLLDGTAREIPLHWQAGAVSARRWTRCVSTSTGVRCIRRCPEGPASPGRPGRLARDANPGLEKSNLSFRADGFLFARVYDTALTPPGTGCARRAVAVVRPSAGRRMTRLYFAYDLALVRQDD